MKEIGLMFGGKYTRAWLALAAVLLAPAICAHLAAAHDGQDDCECIVHPPEQSIVVDNGESQDFASLANSADDDGLEPIAIATDLVPELADPPASAEPSLADPLPPEPETLEIVERLQQAERSVVATEQADPEAKALSFHGITPGISNRIKVLRTWGDPRSEVTTASKLKYRFDSLKNVFVHFDGNVVDAIDVELPGALQAEKLIKSLDLESIRPTIVRNDEGQPQSCVFPERGVELRIVENDSQSSSTESCNSAQVKAFQIAKVIIQPIKAEPFLQRAKNETTCNLSLAMKDLKQALQLDHNCAGAKWLMSVQLLKTGRAIRAERLAAEAVEAEPDNNTYRLQLAKCLRMLARYDVAAKHAKRVFKSSDENSLLQARALREMGLLASLGTEELAQRVVPLLSNAIATADKLSISANLQESVESTELLVDAHLDMALFISKGGYEQKAESVPQWIERASAISEDLIAEDNQHLHLRLQVAVTALAAVANLEPATDPQPWIDEAQETAKLLYASTADPLLHEMYDWSLGIAYFQAAQIEHLRQRPHSALRMGELAQAKLNKLAGNRDELPGTSFLMGRLYFQTGVVHAIHFDDHLEACTWYDRAVDRLIDPFPVTMMSGSQQHGDALVSMGVSYWQQNQHERAVRLTQKGADLIKQAVDKGVLGDDALLVPYGNLAAMYEAQGKTRSAAKYTRLAKQIDQTDSAEQRR